MAYYKIIENSSITGVCSDLDMRKYQAKHRIIVACNSDLAEYIQYEEKLYHAQWMAPVKTDAGVVYTEAEIAEIEGEEYTILSKALDTGEQITEDNSEEPAAVDEPAEQDMTVEFVRDKKVAETSSKCSSAITNGFDIVLSDGEQHHFSLSTQDQLNLITLTSMVASGETNIPYHADGELCKFFSAEDISSITGTATMFKTYHVSYFNSLKAYIESLENIEDIDAVEYGMKIPEAYMSEVLKALESSADNG